VETTGVMKKEREWGVFKGSPKSWQSLGEKDQKPVEPVCKPVDLGSLIYSSEDSTGLKFG
jgi:hypothetical protein